MPESLSLIDRYRALAEGKQLQIRDADGHWVDYSPMCHPLALANEWQVKPASPTTIIDNGTFGELRKCVAYTGAKPFDHLSGLLSQLSNIVAGYVDQRRRLEAFETGVISGLTTDQLLRVGQAANVLLQDYEKGEKFRDVRLKVDAWEQLQPGLRRAQALCTRLKLGPLGGDLIDILCDRVEADEKEKVEAAHSEADIRISLRRALTNLINACGGHCSALDSNSTLVGKAEEQASIRAPGDVKTMVDLRVAIIRLVNFVGGDASAEDSNAELVEKARSVEGTALKKPANPEPRSPIDGDMWWDDTDNSWCVFRQGRIWRSKGGKGASS